MEILQHNANPLSQIHRGNVIDINVIEKNLAIIEVIKTGEELDQRALPRPGRPDNR